uniref:FUN14 domain-containing protein 1 n=1 Tax=Magallana gigas TaxID=29159 RepID=A0A8W8IYL1_MAGGI
MTHKRDKNEILDVVNYKDGWLRDMVKDVTKRSTAQQVVIGGVSGWVSGYLFIKVGKLAAITLGTSILVLQIAQHKGYVKIDYSLLQKDVETAKKVLEKQAKDHYPGVLETLKRCELSSVRQSLGYTVIAISVNRDACTSCLYLQAPMTITSAALRTRRGSGLHVDDRIIVHRPEASTSVVKPSEAVHTTLSSSTAGIKL